MDMEPIKCANLAVPGPSGLNSKGTTQEPRQQTSNSSLSEGSINVICMSSSYFTDSFYKGENVIIEGENLIARVIISIKKDVKGKKMGKYFVIAVKAFANATTSCCSAEAHVVGNVDQISS